MSTKYTLHVGQRLTDYNKVDITIERVARGGMGLVVMGPNHFEGDRWLALKTIQPEALQRNPDLGERFIREGLIWRGIWVHPNILSMHFITKIDRVPFLVMEYAEHGSLAEVLAHGRLPLASVLIMAQNIAAGLVALHTPDPEHLRPQPIVHRDLKPDNVLINEANFAVITDFGLVALLPYMNSASALREDTLVDATRSTHFQTKQGSIMGTMAYMAPEQWVDSTLTGPPVDLYALGLILGQALTSEHPLLSLYQRHSVSQWRIAHERGTPRRLQDVVPETPVPLERLYQSLLAKQAVDRPTADETLTTLNMIAQRLNLPPYSPPVIQEHTTKNEMIYWQSWANAFDHFGFYPEALVRNNRAYHLAPHEPAVLLDRGIILKNLQRWQEALSAYKEALQFIPAENAILLATAYVSIGNLHSDQEQFMDAESAYEKAIAATPNAADVWYERGLNEARWGMAERQGASHEASHAHLLKAREYAQRMQTLDPFSTAAQQLLAMIEMMIQQIS